MIAIIQWKITSLDFTSVTLLPNSGVGYEVNINELTYSKIALDEEIQLFIYHSISEGFQSLYGFLTLDEKKVFTELVKISWVGWKVALQLLSAWSDRLLEAVQNEDKKFLLDIKWIGQKMAEKILLELRDKDMVKVHLPKKSENTSALWRKLERSIFDQIKSSLVNMWYKEYDVDRELKDVPLWYETIDQILPYIIKKLS
jgi:holliday junction DNA helicase RuvA